MSAEQLDDTCGAFREYITETAAENPNLANGIKDGLRICLSEMLDYIGDAPEDYEDDFYSDYDKATAALVYEMKYALEKLAN